MYEYAKLIADRVIEKRSTPAPATRKNRFYWAFVSRTYNKLATGGMLPSTVLRENQLLVTTGSQCAYCGAIGVALHWEHIIPLSRNGPNTIDNMVLSCARCNLEKGPRNPLEWFAAKGLDSGAIPRLVMGKATEGGSRKTSGSRHRDPIGVPTWFRVAYCKCLPRLRLSLASEAAARGQARDGSGQHPPQSRMLIEAVWRLS